MSTRREGLGPRKGLKLTLVLGRHRDPGKAMPWLWTQIELRLSDLLGQVPSPGQDCFRPCPTGVTTPFLEHLCARPLVTCLTVLTHLPRAVILGGGYDSYNQRFTAPENPAAFPRSHRAPHARSQAQAAGSHPSPWPLRFYASCHAGRVTTQGS